MATPKVGRGGAIGIGVELTWGTEAARTKWFGVESSDIERAAQFEDVNILVGSTGSANAVEVFQASEATTGTIRFPWSYADMGLILKNALGGTPATTGSGPYVHTYKLGVSLPVGLTLEQVRGNNSGGAEEFYGCKINTLKLSCEARGYLVAEIGVIGKTGGARASGTSPAYTTPYRVLHHHGGDLSFDSANYKVKSIEWMIDNKLATVDEVQSLYTAEPERGDRVEVTCRATIHYYNDVLYTAHLAQTASDLAMTFTDPVTSYSMAITLHNAIIKECKTPINRMGILEQTVMWKGYSDGTDEGFQVVITNAQTTAIE